jgi:hypothetical protein
VLSAALHHSDNSPFDDGVYATVRYNPNKKQSKIRITLKSDPSACT